jgi:hypothetical protein
MLGIELDAIRLKGGVSLLYFFQKKLVSSGQ